MANTTVIKRKHLIEACFTVLEFESIISMAGSMRASGRYGS